VADPTKSGSATVTITPQIVETVQISPPGPLHVALGGTKTFAATVQPDPLNQGVVWTLTCTADGESGSFVDCTHDQDGDLDENTLSNNTSSSVLLTAASNLDELATSYTLTLTATSVATGTDGKTAVTTVTITVP